METWKRAVLVPALRRREESWLRHQLYQLNADGLMPYKDLAPMRPLLRSCVSGLLSGSLCGGGLALLGLYFLVELLQVELQLLRQGGLVREHRFDLGEARAGIPHGMGIHREGGHSGEHVRKLWEPRKRGGCRQRDERKGKKGRKKERANLAAVVAGQLLEVGHEVTHEGRVEGLEALLQRHADRNHVVQELTTGHLRQ